MNKITAYFICFSLLFNAAAFAQKNKTKNPPIKYIDRANIDNSVKPGDNFYLYANGTWLKNNPVPASKTRWGSFEKLAERSSERIRELAEDAAANTSKNSIAQRVGDFYTSGMDSAAIEKAGYNPIKADLKRIEGITTSEQVLNEIATLREKGAGSPLFSFFVAQDSKDVNTYIPRLMQGGTSLPDRDYYISDNARMKSIRKDYQSYMEDMFKLIGDNDQLANQKASAILALETALAKVQMSRVEMRNPKKTYNKYSLADFSKETPGFNWTSLLKTMKVTGADSLLVNNPE